MTKFVHAEFYVAAQYNTVVTIIALHVHGHRYSTVVAGTIRHRMGYKKSLLLPRAKPVI